MRLPPFGTIDSRDGTLTKSPFLRNGYIVKQSESSIMAEKRPGLRLYDSLGVSTGRGLLSFIDPATGEESLFPIAGTTIQQSIDSVTNSLSAKSSEGSNEMYSVWIAGGDGTTTLDYRMESPALINHGGYLWALYGTQSRAGYGIPGQYGYSAATTRFDREFAYYSSDNGANFTAAFDVADGSGTYPDSRVCCVLSYNNKLWILGGYDGASNKRDVWSSSDGVTWTQVTATVSNWTSGRTAIRACVHNNKMYALVGATSASSAASYDGVCYSTDGITWTFTANKPWTTTSPASESRLGFMHSVSGNLVISQVPRASSYHDAAYSTDNGETWTLVDATNRGYGIAAYVGQINGWKVGGSIWTIYIKSQSGSYNTLGLEYTNDGITWTEVTTWQVAVNYSIATPSTSAWNATQYTDYTSGSFGPITPPAVTSEGVVWLSRYYVDWPHTPPIDGNARWDMPLNLLAFANSPIIVSIGTVVGDKFDAQQEYDLTTMAIKSTTKAYQLDTVNYTLSAVTDTDYPSQTVRGLVYLNGIFYVMDPDGTIYGSAEDDFTSWDATNYVSAEFEPDGGRGIAKLDTYLVAFGIFTTEFFWDAGNASGSTLSPVNSAPIPVGCVNGDGIQEMEGAIIFPAQSKGSGQTYTGGKFIAKLQGTQITRLSTPSIDKLLETDGMSDIDALVLSKSGQTFYILQLNTSAITLVYHDQGRQWYQWTQQTVGSDINVSSITRVREIATVTTGSAHGLSTGDLVEISGANQSGYNGVFPVTVSSSTVFTIQVNPSTTTPATGTIVMQAPTAGQFKPNFACSFQGMQLCLGGEDGNVYEFDEDTYQDNSEFVDFRIRTDKYDGRAKDKGGNNDYKEMNSVDIIADKTSSGNLFFRWTDDDFQNWSSWRWMDPTLPRTRTNRLGSFRRRSCEILFTENLPYRIEAIEGEIT